MNDDASIGAMYGTQQPGAAQPNPEEPGQRRRPWSMQGGQGQSPWGQPQGGQPGQGAPQWRQPGAWGGGQTPDWRAMGNMFQGGLQQGLSKLGQLGQNWFGQGQQGQPGAQQQPKPPGFPQWPPQGQGAAPKSPFQGFPGSQAPTT